MFYLYGENFLRRKLFPVPLSKNFWKGIYFFAIISALDGGIWCVCIAPEWEVFSQVFFKKLARVWGE